MWRLSSPVGRSKEQSEGEFDAGLAAVLFRVDAGGGFFDTGRPVRVARAPGRLDLMGGIADYSGGLVLELPLAEATWVIAQEHPAPEVVVTSTAVPAADGDSAVTIPLAGLLPVAGPLEYAHARALFAALGAGAWPAYALGGLVALHRDYARPLRHGLRVLVHSDVPEGKGISSSAALEVACLQVFASFTDAALDERALALLAQTVENLIVGAPCGVMDQLTAAAGRRAHVIEILCQPAEVRGHLPLPVGLEVFGIDSGIRHAVSGASYGRVRAATFMGYRIIADLAGLTARALSPGLVQIEDGLFGGYLANVPPALWRARFRDLVPEACLGQDFLARYQGFTDKATAIAPTQTYAVRASTEHPIREHARVQRFRQLLATGAADEASRTELGALMHESHASYSACGLGSDGTDLLVHLVRAAGPQSGLYGAKITGGGSGGTVAVLARAGARAAVDRVVAAYTAATGRASRIFAGSSAGASAFGVRRLVPEA